MDTASSDQAPPADKNVPVSESDPEGDETEKGDPYFEFFEDFSPSVVNVAYEAEYILPTVYGTGFILMSEKKYTVIFANNRKLASRQHTRRKYHVYFDAQVKIEAEVLEHQEFLILLVRDDKERMPVRFCADPIGHEEVTTIGAMGGARLHVSSPVIHTLIGILGNYTGDVTTTSCAARDSHGNAIKGSERFFRLECFALDQITTLENVDVKGNQTAHRIVSAPVFRLTTGEMVGIVYSASDWCDIKKAIHAKDIQSGLVRLFKSHDPKITTWEEGVKKWAERIMQSTD